VAGGKILWLPSRESILIERKSVALSNDLEYFAKKIGLSRKVG